MRLALAAVLALAVAAPAAADLNETCWETVPSFRLSALVCPKVPRGIGG
jgi:hypothetical protein